MLEVNLVVHDCETALNFYEKLFGATRKSLTSLPPGQNEAIMVLEGTHIHLFDENKAVNFVAPKRGDNAYMWWHLIVTEIDALYARAMEMGCRPMDPLRDLSDYGVRQGVILDPIGYSWILTQMLT